MKKGTEEFRAWAREWARQYRKKNRELLAVKQKAYVVANPEKRAASNREYAAKNRKKLLVYHREYWAKTRDQQCISRLEWRKARREELCRKQREYVANNPEIGRVAGARRRARVRGAEGNGWTPSDVATQFTAQRGRCFYCKVKLGKSFHRDHVIPLSKGGRHDRANMVLACRRCNSSKHDKSPQEFAGILL